MTPHDATADNPLSIFASAERDIAPVRLRLLGGRWIGFGDIDKADLDEAAGIAAASDYRVMISDSSDPTLARVAGWCNHRSREIKVAVRGHWLMTLAHETAHAVMPRLPADDVANLFATVRRMFPSLTEWQREHGGWSDSGGDGEKFAQLFASWRVRSTDHVTPDDERTLRIFCDIAAGKYAVSA